MAEATLHVTDANSAESIQALEGILKDLHGVERALVDTSDGEVKIQYDDTLVSQERIVITLQQHGFHLQ
ncbi:heavy-metal-associated domain-containing protein [Ectobacillus ponti]|uniref:HMA domain-containing protein n=1 Tax=Ectobacillus ponti TaxID=2961894 RepID=A0AA41XBU6_9BACI|nr:hypothetical protein [Ectobacillus ponti]MCP8970065.1 hypothetical protein [Ectobacillus ponti]